MLASVMETDRVIRTGESFLYAQEIQKPFGILDGVLDWCRSELTGDWRWQLVQPSTDRDPGRYCFYFDSSRDMCAFKLRWM
jgi:hypothetical protein